MPTSPNLRPLQTSRLVALVSFCVLLLAVVAPRTALGQIPAGERTALIDLYNSTNGASWTNNTGWVTQTPGTECTWFGVTCDGTPVVTQIFLPGNLLSGPLPSTIGNLTNLNTLWLQSNQISGSIPTTIGNLTNVFQLSLFGNQLTGSIPTEVGNMTSLQFLYLGVNQLSGTIPASLGNLTVLNYLELASNQLTGSIPTSLGNLTALQQFRLEFNLLTGTIPAELGNLTSVQNLFLSNNQLTGSIPTTLGSLSGVVTLNLSANQLSGTIPVELGNMLGLQYLFLQGNQLTGSIPAVLGSLPSLRLLDLGFNQLSGTIPSALGSLPLLQNLLLDVNLLTGSIPTEIGNLSGLQQLWLQSNQLSGSIPVSLSGIAELIPGNLDIRWNALYTSDAGLIGYLNSRQAGGDWAGTQTIAPTGVAANGVGPDSIQVTWTTIAYTGDTGYYEVLGSTAPGGPYAPAGQTANKSATSLTVSGLLPSTPYYFIVRAVTLPHGQNQNMVTSENSLEATGSTLSCGYSLLPPAAPIPAAGAAGQVFQVQTTASCPWTATSNDAWITVTGGAAGVGTGNVTYDVAANTGPLRVGTITAGGQVFSVTQADGCSFLLNPTSAPAPAGGAVGQIFQVQTGVGCNWTATSNDAWITVYGGQPAAPLGTGLTITVRGRTPLESGTANVIYDVAPNAGPLRVGTITAGGQTFTVTQADGCAYLLNPASAPAPAGGAAGQIFQVQTSASCPWTATSNDAWITVTGGAAGSGTGNVTYDVAPNAGPLRIGTITAGGQTFTVTQADGCAFLLNPASAPAPAGGALGQVFQVQTGAGCNWTATSNDAWITVTGGAAGVGTGNVTYDVAANVGPLRVGTITAGGQTFTVTQADGCSYLLNPTNAPAPAGGAAGQIFQVQTTASCPWTATSNDAWITVTGGAAGSGTGNVTYSVAANVGPLRVGTITAGGQTFTVTQADGCAFLLNPASAPAPPGGAAGQIFQVETAAGCNWTATSNDAWLTITGGAAGVGTGSVTYSVAANAGPQRVGTITAGGQTFTVTQASGCTYLLNPSNVSAPVAGATGLTFQVQTAASCPWTAISNDAWITVTGGAAGTGTGNVTFNVAANVGPLRAGTITAGGQTFTVTQGDGCTAVLNPVSAPAPAAGAAGLTFQVQASPGCPWTATSNVPWITVTGGATGVGNANVTYSVAANTGANRTGSITAAGQTFLVTQVDGCTYALTPPNATAPSTGAVGQTLQVQTAAGCAWAASANDAWITITAGASGTGTGTVTYSVAASNGSQRTGSINAAGQTFTITQAAACTYVLSPVSAPAPAAGAAGQTFQVQTAAGCAFTAISNDAWITLTGGASGSGTATVTYSVAANTGVQRVGTITAGGQTFTVTQASGCAYTLSPAGAPAPATGAAGQTFQVQTAAGCTWTAISNDAWITLTGGASGTGNGTVTYSVAANSGAQRTGTITAGGQTFTVTQSSGCAYTLNPASAPAPAAGAAGSTFQVQTAAGCTWTAVPNDAWITLTGGASGTGSGTVTYSVAANSGAQRTGTITAGGQTFTVTQSSGCTYALNPASAPAPAAGAAGQTFQVVTAAACPWTAASNAPWITITAGASGTGNGTVTYGVAANPGPARTGTITAGNVTFTVNQAEDCAASFALEPTSASVPAAGTLGQTFQVRAAPGCSWSATSNDAWITITAGASGTGTGTVTYSVTASAGPGRTGSITAAGLTFIIDQADSCATGATLDPVSANAPAVGATGQSFQVLTSPSCPWAATSNAGWITVVSGSFGTGNGTVLYSVAANPGPARTGAITAAGQTFIINQADGCDASTTLQPVAASVAAAGATGQTFQVQAAIGCSWTAASNAPWITVTSGTFGAGVGTVTYGVATNTGAERTGTITAAGKTFTVSQAAACNAPSVPQLTSYPTAPVVAGSSFAVAWGAVADLPEAGTYEVRVSTNADCSSPAVTITTGLSVTIPTDPSRTMTYCVQVRAVGTCAPEAVSAYSAPITVRSVPLPAVFTVIQGQNPAARAGLDEVPPAGSTVVFRNVGETAGTLTFSATGGFFTISPQTAPDVARGADVTVSIVFATNSTNAAGVKTGELIGSWSTGEGLQSVATAITLTVLGSPRQLTRGMKLEPVGSSDVHFRQLEGNPEPREIAIRNTGSLPVRIAPSIGPGGSWLSVSGDFATPVPAGAERSFELTVDRSRRTTEDGPAPLSTGLRIENVDGDKQDSAIFEVFDEEPRPPTSGTNRPDLTESEFSLILGSSASTTPSGARDAQAASAVSQVFSDGYIRNRGSDPATVDLFYAPEGAQGLTDPRVKKNTITLAGYSSYRLSDFVRGLFEESGSGHVELRSPQLPQLSIRMSVNVDTTRDGVPAQYGSEVPLFVTGQGVVVSDGSGPSEVILLTGLQGSLAGRRSNIVLSETLGKSIEVRARLYDASGKRLGQKTVFVNPYTKIQINAGDPELFPVAYRDGTVEIEPIAGDGAVSAFATVMDEGSRSYTVRVGTILPRPKTSPRASLAVADSTAFLPTITREETTDAFYTTRLSITNGSDSDVTLKVTYVPDRGFGDVTEPKSIVIPKRGGEDGEGGPQTVTYVDVVKDFLGIESGTRGMLKVEGGLTGIAFSSETTTPLDPNDPALGNSLSSVNPAPGVEQKIAGAFSAESKEVTGMKLTTTDAVSPEVSLPAIEEGPQFRTNLILAELAGEASKVRVLLRKAGGASLGEPMVVELGPNERKQIQRIISEITKTAVEAADFKDVEIIVQAVEGKGRTLGLVNRIANDPASKRLDTYVLGPNVTGAKRKGQK